MSIKQSKAYKLSVFLNLLAVYVLIYFFIICIFLLHLKKIIRHNFSSIVKYIIMGILYNLLKPSLCKLIIFFFLLNIIALAIQLPRTSPNFVSPKMSLWKDTLHPKIAVPENPIAFTLLSKVQPSTNILVQHYFLLTNKDQPRPTKTKKNQDQPKTKTN